MYQEKDARRITDGNEHMDFAFFSAVGDREEQQDSFGYYLDNDDAILVICDGMGGHQGGAEASNAACKNMIEQYQAADKGAPVYEVLIHAARQADAVVSELRDQAGVKLCSGSTVVAVAVRGRSLYWLSVGDSRIYLKRGKEFRQVTFDHTYSAVLNEQLQSGEITKEEYQREFARGAALISYIGIGKLELIDYNDEAFALQPGDTVLLMSDGLYKNVSDNEINTMLESFADISDLMYALDARAARNARHRDVGRDNTTFAVIKIK